MSSVCSSPPGWAATHWGRADRRMRLKRRPAAKKVGSRESQCPIGPGPYQRVWHRFRRFQVRLRVLTASASMGNGPHMPLAAAKTETSGIAWSRWGPRTSSRSSSTTSVPKIFSLAGYPGQIVYATDINKRQARSFVPESMTAEGGTGHLAATQWRSVSARCDLVSDRRRRAHMSAVTWPGFGTRTRSR